MHHVLAHTVAHPNLELFGENMTATHSISYGNLTSYFYLFGARKRGVWCSWDEVERIAKVLGVPTVPVVFKGTLGSTRELRALIERLAQGRSAVGAEVQPEGFVLRLSRRFRADEFGSVMAKYVRPNHVQTGDDFSKLYPRNKAKLCAEALPEATVALWQTAAEPEPEVMPVPVEPEPMVRATTAIGRRPTAAAGGGAGGGGAVPKRLSGKAKKEAAAAEKMRRNRRKQAPKLLVLAGLPGCGKSTFAKALEASDPQQWVHADSDVLRREMESVVGRAASGRNPKRVIVDKCNGEPRDRKAWPGIAHQPAANDAMLVVFDVDVEECCSRVVARVGHPTISDNQPNAAAIVRSFAKRWAPPGSQAAALAEGYGRFLRVESAQDVEQLLISLGVDPAAAACALSVPIADTPADAAADAADTGLGLVRTRSAQERARREAAEAAERAAQTDAAEAEAELIAVRKELGALQGKQSRQRGRSGR
jgi:predicted kinase